MLPATLRSSDYRGADTLVTAMLGGQEVVFRAPGRVAVEGGETVRLAWDADAAHIFDARTGRRLDEREAPRAMARAGAGGG